MSRNRKGGGLSAILVVLVLSMVIILLCGVYIQIRDAEDDMKSYSYSSSIKQNANSSSSSSLPPSSSSSVEEEPPSSSSGVEEEPPSSSEDPDVPPVDLPDSKDAETAAQALFKDFYIGLVPDGSGRLFPVCTVDLDAWNFLFDETDYDIVIGSITGMSIFNSEKIEADGWKDSNINACIVSYSDNFALTLPYWAPPQDTYLSLYYSTDLSVNASGYYRGDRLTFQGENKDKFACDCIILPADGSLNDRLYWSRVFVMLTDAEGNCFIYYGPNCSVIPSEEDGWQDYLP